MYKKNLESVTYSDLSILLIIFLNRTAISLLTFFFSLNLKKKSSSLLLLTSILKILYLFFFFYKFTFNTT